MRVLFTVRRCYYDAIVAGTKTCEIRKATKRWESVAGHLAFDALRGETSQAVFICGRTPIHRRLIIGIKWHCTPEAALGRDLSEQERKDVGSGPMIAFELGEVVT
jgi:hypothetical protein